MLNSRNSKNSSAILEFASCITDSNDSHLELLDSTLLQTLEKPIDSLQSQLFSTNSCEFLPKLYGIWKSIDEIDFDKLPNAFVLKTNHDCGGVVIVPNKQAFLSNTKLFNESMQKLKEHLATNYYELYKEWHYKDIEARVFGEELLGANLENQTQDSRQNQNIENDGFQASKANMVQYKVPNDYKFHCFSRFVMANSHKEIDRKIYIQVDTERFSNHSRTIFDDKSGENAL